MFAGLAVLSLSARRNIAVFALGAAPFVGQCLAALKSLLPQPVGKLRQVGSMVLSAVMPVGMIAAAWFVASNGFYRWNWEPHEFGTGVLDIGFPVKAAAFAAKMQLPPPLFNDLTSGGYLAWAQPIEGGVYIDGRLEVYDTEFFAAYLAALAHPNQWQVEADRAGIQTVVLFHRWGNHRPLIGWLLKNPQWALVYYDEVALVFVRRTNHEELIDRCRDPT